MCLTQVPGPCTSNIITTATCSCCRKAPHLRKSWVVRYIGPHQGCRQSASAGQQHCDELITSRNIFPYHKGVWLIHNRPPVTGPSQQQQPTKQPSMHSCFSSCAAQTARSPVKALPATALSAFSQLCHWQALSSEADGTPPALAPARTGRPWSAQLRGSGSRSAECT